MAKRYLGIIVTYIVAQLSILPVAIISSKMELNPSTHNNLVMGWQITSFVLALLITLVLLRKEKTLPKDPDRASPTMTVVWSILGFFMALAGQSIARMIQTELLGIQEQSQNTVEIMEITRSFPIFIIVVAVIGPILEEIIFRKIIFGQLYKETNFIIAGTISGLIFAVIHNDFTHLLVYFVMSFVFAFIYVKTKRVIVPILAHVSMNTFVIIIQLFFAEHIIEEINQVQAILIGG
ncbi:CPBP family intramembrane metalloprotease [Amphibacillus sp. MSJ-3]|uniref:CPBP family intramembrane glutamic endopeptidase n=1 Tax=Amphibacillus sp. MSJ-3 TaxID=2841505 RepID=UPI001C0F0106|nr:CPBP family intramembrane glutamic endopeptidase [Amphibacillus sp. MSJ-3]MBU5595344.1 CPBP family intramembrane metalloprotease [Amphibacillus sp. MSJ-3]